MRPKIEVMLRAAILVAGCLVVLGAPATDPAGRALAKLRSIENGRAHPGTVIALSSQELNAFLVYEVPRVVPEGVRAPRVQLGTGRATAYAYVDFLKLRYAQGLPTPWLIAKLLQGERDLKVEARITSAHGLATVSLERVTISGVAVSGSTLDAMVSTFFLTLYPEAKINQPFELAHRLERIEITPLEARAVIRR